MAVGDWTCYTQYGRHGVLNHWQLGCFLNNLCMLTAKLTLKLGITGLLWWNSMDSPRTSKAGSISISWRQNENFSYRRSKQLCHGSNKYPKISTRLITYKTKLNYCRYICLGHRDISSDLCNSSMIIYIYNFYIHLITTCFHVTYWQWNFATCHMSFSWLAYHHPHLHPPNALPNIWSVMWWNYAMNVTSSKLSHLQLWYRVCFWFFSCSWCMKLLWTIHVFHGGRKNYLSKARTPNIRLASQRCYIEVEAFQITAQTTRLFVSQLVQFDTKISSEVRGTEPMWGGSTNGQWVPIQRASNMKIISMSWREHGMWIPPYCQRKEKVILHNIYDC